MYFKNLSINQTKQEHFAKGYNHFGQTILCDYVLSLNQQCMFFFSKFLPILLYLNIILLYYFLCMYIS